MLLTARCHRRPVFALFNACALVSVATVHEGGRVMSAAQADDQLRLQNYYTAETKYQPTPVPTPLDRGAAVAFINANVTPTISPDRMRKLMRVAVFYNLGETAAAFRNVLTGRESAPTEIARAALAIIALAWIGSDEQ